MLMLKIVQSLRRDQHDALMKFYDAGVIICVGAKVMEDSWIHHKFLPSSWVRQVRAIWNG